ncbi:MAG TPA: glycosyltransferase family 2 protein [Marmoricola sp.]|nr:glycosyltransferase family 2 protein [Marmoricola sp.]
MSELTRVAIVIVHYGDIRRTVALANDLAQAPESHREYGFCIVANDLSERPTHLAPNFRWMKPDTNLGYGGAANLAVDDGDFDYLILLNNDLSIDWVAIERLLLTIESDRYLAVVAPRIVGYDGIFRSGPGRLSAVTKSPIRLEDPGQRIVHCDWVTGAAMVIRLRNCPSPPFDSSYFLGSEDLDLCIRAKEFGLHVACVGSAVARHEVSASIGTAWAYYGPRNRLWLVRKNWGRGPRWWLTAAFVAIKVGRFGISSLVRGRPPRLVRWQVKGFLDGMRPPPSTASGPLPGEPIAFEEANW